MSVLSGFDTSCSRKVKEIERLTNHDVKAVEYFLKEHLSKSLETTCLKEYVHFCCTSEDINNLSYSRMLQDSLSVVVFPLLDTFLSNLSSFAIETASVPLLSLTHGQSATPTTFGREMTVFVYRLRSQLLNVNKISCVGKFNGATGSFNAHLVAYPNVDWEALASEFVTSLGLVYQPVSTQIECHDYIAEIMDGLSRICTILLGFSRDLWMYISRGVVKLRAVPGEVGSSTMPHKVNPIDFENAEGNLGIAIALFEHFARKLPISRLQRDLSDSTVLRNIGTGFAHMLVALESLMKGIGKISVCVDTCEAELGQNWSLLAEPVQTMLRKHNVPNGYEKLKDFTRGTSVDESAMTAFIDSLESVLPQDDFKNLKKLTPTSYLGIAEKIARKYAQ